MRILYLCADHGIPMLGRRGCSTHVRETCRALQEVGHEIVVLCSRKGHDEGLDQNLRIIERSPSRFRVLGYDLRNFWHNLPLYREARRIVETEKIDAIYERFSLYSLVGAWLEKRYHLPRIVEVNAFLSVEHHHKVHFLRLAEMIEAHVVRNAPALVVVSEPLREALMELGVPPARISIMPMAVNVSHFRPDPQRGREVRAKWNLEGKYVVGYVGSLSAWHGISLLPEMARRMLPHCEDFVILVVGGDAIHVRKHRAAVRELGLGRSIIFTGSVPYQDVPGHINAMDVALVPDTNYWTCPTKMFEYQASGVPTVAPEYPAILQAMRHGEEGMLFAPRKVEQAVQHILYLADKPELRRRMGEKARARVAATHSWQNNVERIMYLFENMQRGNHS